MQLTCVRDIVYKTTSRWFLVWLAGMCNRLNRNFEGKTMDKANRATRIFRLIFQNYEGNLAIRLWNGETMQLGPGEPEATLVFHHGDGIHQPLCIPGWRTGQG